jgi:Fic family protein
MLFRTPTLADRDQAVISELEALRRQLRHVLRQPRHWTGNLRRNLQARAIRGSNTIEGYDVSLDDALAAVDDEEPMDADRQTWMEIMGYRNAMTYVQQLAQARHFAYNLTLLSGLHFMMLGHDLSKLPGQLRPGPVYVHDEETDTFVYEGPDAELVPGLINEFIESLDDHDGEPVLVRAAMAHLNLVMIHPFKDGNGRMARSLQTLVLARDGILAPEFSSIEEYLGSKRNTQDYYAVLARVGEGSWNPGNDAGPWISFNLRAHHIQAQTVLRRVEETRRLWGELARIAAENNLPDRVIPALYDASIGFRVRRSKYETDADVEPATATRDLRRLVDVGLLEARGETRGRRYVGSRRLRELYEEVRIGRAPIVDPYDALGPSSA